MRVGAIIRARTRARTRARAWTRARGPVLGALAAIVLGAIPGGAILAQDGTDQPTSEAPVVVIRDGLEPSQVEVAAGSAVTWRNDDDERHRMRSREGPVPFDSGNLEPGESFTLTFGTEGSYPYYDHRDRDDPAYFGTVVVVPGGTVAPGELPAAGHVSIIDRSFAPASFSVATGGSVTWTNDDGESHTVTSSATAFDSGILGEGATFSQTFPEAGSYPYVCLIHPEMRGTIEVDDPVATEPEPVASPAPSTSEAPAPAPPGSASALEPVPVSIIDRAFQPASIKIAVGDSVAWSNDDGTGHTVTAVDGSFNSGVLTVGADFVASFDTAGQFGYFCAIHPDMRGTVTVTEPALEPQPTAAGASPPAESVP